MEFGKMLLAAASLIKLGAPQVVNPSNLALSKVNYNDVNPTFPLLSPQSGDVNMGKVESQAMFNVENEVDDDIEDVLKIAPTETRLLSRKSNQTAKKEPTYACEHKVSPSFKKEKLQYFLRFCETWYPSFKDVLAFFPEIEEMTDIDLMELRYEFTYMFPAKVNRKKGFTNVHPDGSIFGILIDYYYSPEFDDSHDWHNMIRLLENFLFKPVLKEREKNDQYLKSFKANQRPSVYQGLFWDRLWHAVSHTNHNVLTKFFRHDLVNCTRKQLNDIKEVATILSKDRKNALRDMAPFRETLNKFDHSFRIGLMMKLYESNGVNSDNDSRKATAALIAAADESLRDLDIIAEAYQ